MQKYLQGKLDALRNDITFVNSTIDLVTYRAIKEEIDNIFWYAENNSVTLN